MHNYEEYHEWSTLWSWLFIIFLSGSLISIAMTVMFLVKDVPREWDYGTLKFTPAESIYSSVNPDTVKEEMIEPLPEGVSMEEAE